MVGIPRTIWLSISCLSNAELVGDGVVYANMLLFFVCPQVDIVTDRYILHNLLRFCRSPGDT